MGDGVSLSVILVRILVRGRGLMDCCSAQLDAQEPPGASVLLGDFARQAGRYNQTDCACKCGGSGVI
jgi:hypothetical protein